MSQRHELDVVELQQCLASRVPDISPFVDQLMRSLKPCIERSRDGDGSDVDIAIAVSEAIANAVIHGNHENPHKWVYVDCRCNLEGEVTITVRDEGEGFELSSLPDPTDEAHLMLAHVRGIRMMQALMDEVTFQEHGTVDEMRKLPGARSRP